MSVKFEKSCGSMNVMEICVKGLILVEYLVSRGEEDTLAYPREVAYCTRL